jgi:5-methylcytosine-specific restriction endonuclease McrBC regulatory subunit McrC
MANEIEAVEGRQFDLYLTAEEAEVLSAIGRNLASTTSWWGGDTEPDSRSVIHLVGHGNGIYRVLFKDVIGLVRLGTRQIKVLPKIPIQHFLYLAGKSEIGARLSEAAANVDSGIGFVELLSIWFLDAAEKLIAQGLRKDYQETNAEVAEVRGSIHVVPTVRLVAMGTPSVACSFDDLTVDSAMNRVVLAACKRIVQLDPISEVTRRRARRSVFRMDGVGSLHPADMRVTVDRVSKSYARVLPLAKLVLNGCGITLASGGYRGTSFLIRSPEIIENGYRAVIAEALPDMKVVKQRQLLGDTGLSMNPDLVIGDGLAIGDIKYKHLTAHWNSPDLNQAVAFASSFRSNNCAVFGFVSGNNAPQPRPVPVGSIRVRTFGWVASGTTAPEDSATNLKQQVQGWVKSLIPSNEIKALKP